MKAIETPVCPRHKLPLTVVEEGVLNGVLTRYWGLCSGRMWTGAPCPREVRTEESSHDEPELFA